MPQAFKQRLRSHDKNRQDYLSCRHGGITIVEVLVAAGILVIGVAGTVSAFNLATSFLGKSSTNNAANNAIDDDIARIRSLSYVYTSCVAPAGSIPAAGTCDVNAGQSRYYFPKSSLQSDINAFFAACRSTSASSHITAGFITAINGLSAVGSGVTRGTATREAATDASNHNIIVSYTQNGAVVRVLKVAPIVSAWCG